MKNKIQPEYRGKTLCCILLLGFLISAVTGLSGCGSQQKITAGDFPFAMPTVKEPSISKRTFKITDFGAVDDGHTLNTDAFARAIGACTDAGGGRVIVPAGLWLTGPIILKSDLELYLEQGGGIPDKALA